MHAFFTPQRLTFALVLLVAAVAGSTRAQEVAPDPAPEGVDVTDSLAHPLPDSSSAAVDSLAGLVADPGDSVSTQSGDSAGESSWAQPWRPAPVSVDRTLLDWTRPEDFDRALDWLGRSSVRVAGETGMDAFVNAGPLSQAPELMIDGVPSRSPADLDPAIWDRTSTMVTQIGSTDQQSDRAWGEAAINATMDSPLAGRTVLHTFFTNSAYDSYTRAIGVRAPGTKRMLRFDFQEFKTESGYQYSDSPEVVVDPSNRGRSKQRHFRIGGKTKTSLGELGFEFGRGRRYTRGDVLSSAPHERWTGRLSLGFDRVTGSGSWHARLYHLDFHDDWQDRTGFSLQSTDAARRGLRVERIVEDDGFFGGFTVERQSARFLPNSSVAADTTYNQAWVGLAGAGWRGSDDWDWTPFVSGQVALAEHTADPADLGGRAGIRRSIGAASAQIQVERILRTPTLVESYGVYQRRLVTPVSGGFVYEPSQAPWLFTGGGSMEFERQDRVEARLGGQGGRVEWSLGYSAWWLSRGIGWEATGARQAQVISGLETDLDMLDAHLRVSWYLGAVRLRLYGRGHYMPGGLTLAGGRPGGFPRAAALGRIGLDRVFFSPRNRIGIDLDADFLGEHFDDLTGPIGGVVPASTTLDTRAWLLIRDAELFFAVDNFLDEERVEVLGTRRRYRQFRFGLTWTFYN